MKKSLVVLSLAILTLSSFANAMSGGSVQHNLTCTPNKRLLGMQVGLIVTTAALAPQYSVRGIALTQSVIIPNAPLHVTQLQQVTQTAYNATFSANDIEVNLDKGTLQAALMLGANEYSCK